MPLVMLVLFALPSFGLTTSLARVALGYETLGGANQSQAEELEERVPCSTDRRERSQRVKRYAAWLRVSWTHVQKNINHRDSRRAIVGHRLANGSLAPIRC